jgi:XTP/dITP diphosphohydrolase
MPLISLPEKIVLASGNAKKLAELQSLFSGLPVDVIAQSEFAINDAIEDGLSFVENAIIKARHAAYYSKLPALADDSGIAVDYLDGKPGIHSARFSGEKATDASNNLKLLQLLTNVPESQRSAQFHCVLVYMRHAEDPVPLICHGSWPGYILEKPTGDNGFGYDPLFWVPTHACSSAQLDKAEKNRISHRGHAMQLLLQQFNNSTR